MATSEQLDSSPDGGLVAGSYVLVVLGCALAWYVYTKTDPQPLILDVEGFSVFAPLYITAQAIERFLEPLAAVLNVTTSKKSALRAQKEDLADLLALPADDPRRNGIAAARAEVDKAEAALAKVKATRAIVMWAAASVLGLLVCAAVGLGLVEAIAKQRPSSEFLRTLDVLLTGLAVGAGTKPLHDLISRIEKAKDNADSATKPATSPAT
jgi:hypothetical protein